MTADEKRAEDLIIVHAHVDVPESIGVPLSAETQQKLRDAAKRSANVARVAEERGHRGFVCISVTDREYDRVVASVGTATIDRQALDQRKKSIAQITRSGDSQNVMVLYAALDLQPILDRLATTLAEEQRKLIPKLLLGGKSGTRYDVVKTLFVLIQRMIRARHIRVDHDVDDPNGVALARLVDWLDAANDIPDVVSGVYVEPGELSRIERGQIEPDDYFIMLNDFSMRTMFLAPVAPTVVALERGHSLDVVPAIPEDDEYRRRFVQDSHSFLKYIDQLTGVDQRRRVISGAYLTARDHVWDKPTLSLLNDNSVWCDDAAIAAIRGGECKAVAMSNVVLNQTRFSGLGPTLADVREHTSHYLMRLIRGVVLLDAVAHPVYRTAVCERRGRAEWPETYRQELWLRAHQTLSSLGNYLESLPHTVVGIAARGEPEREFGWLKSTGFVDPYFPNGIGAAVREMKDFRPGDGDAPKFCRTISQLIDDLLLYASKEVHATWLVFCQAAAEVPISEVFPQLEVVQARQL